MMCSLFPHRYSDIAATLIDIYIYIIYRYNFKYITLKEYLFLYLKNYLTLNPKDLKCSTLGKI